MTHEPDERPGRRSIGALWSKARSFRWSMRSRLSTHPTLFLPLARTRYPDAVVGRETEMLIDGFTRSAVTFSVIAFQAAQRRPVRVAHTLHAAGHVIAAVEREIPCLVTARRPDDAVLSAVIREPYVDLRQAFAAYARFYERIRPYRAGFVVAGFNEVAQDFAGVIRRVNERFGTRFDEFEHSAENVRECFKIIEDRARRPPWSKSLGQLECGIIGIEEYREVVASHAGHRPAVIPEMRVPRPSAEREAVKETLRAELDQPRVRRLRARALSAYEAAMEG